MPCGLSCVNSGTNPAVGSNAPLRALWLCRRDHAASRDAFKRSFATGGAKHDRKRGVHGEKARIENVAWSSALTNGGYSIKSSASLSRHSWLGRNVRDSRPPEAPRHLLSPLSNFSSTAVLNSLLCVPLVRPDKCLSRRLYIHSRSVFNQVHGLDVIFRGSHPFVQCPCRATCSRVPRSRNPLSPRSSPSFRQSYSTRH